MLKLFSNTIIIIIYLFSAKNYLAKIKKKTPTLHTQDLWKIFIEEVFLEAQFQQKHENWFHWSTVRSHLNILFTVSMLV